MLENIANILRLINERPNQRNEPLAEDLQGHYTTWFDGGAAVEAEGISSFTFTDGSRAMRNTVGYFYITITLANETKISIIEQDPRAGKDLILIGQQLVEKQKELDDAGKLTEKLTVLSPRQFEFCTRCGHRVEPYAPSDVSQAEFERLGKEPPSVEDDSHYMCSNCEQVWRAFNYFDTSIMCRNCRAMMPFVVEFCGSCGADRLTWTGLGKFVSK